MNDGFDINGLIKKKDLSDPEWLHSEERIATLIRNTAKAHGLRLREPDPHCKRCNGRGWTGVNSVTGDPIICRCIFYPEDLKDMASDVPEEDKKPRNRAERRKKKSARK